MKKSFHKIITILIIILLSISMSSCKSKKETELSKPTEYYLNYNDISVKLNSNYNNIIATLGLSNDERTEETNNKIYSYDDFEIETFLENNAEKIKSFWFTSENITTNEGIKIGDSVEKLKEIYGKPTKSIDDVYVYNLNNTSLSFIAEDNKIINIQYILT